MELLVLLVGLDIGLGALLCVEETSGDGEEGIFGGHFRIVVVVVVLDLIKMIKERGVSAMNDP